MKLELGKLIAEVVIETGWSLEEILRMPLPRFAYFGKTVREVAERKQNEFYLEMTAVVSVAAGDSKYFSQMREHYVQRLLKPGQLEKRRNPRTFDMDDDEQRKAAANILAATLKQKAKLMGIH